jgi:hypothetical protein
VGIIGGEEGLIIVLCLVIDVNVVAACIHRYGRNTRVH